MSSDERRPEILGLLRPETRVIALIALIAEAAILATIPFLPSDQRIYAFAAFICLLVLILASAVYVTRRSKSQDHDQPYFRVKIAALYKKLVADRFLPHLIIAIPRGGLGVAGMLAKQLGDESTVHVITLTHLRQTGFANAFNRISLAPSDFGLEPGQPLNTLIVDDFCRSGRTLNDAKRYVEELTAGSGFVIKTAAISFYKGGYRDPFPPSFFVDRPEEPKRDTFGELEPIAD